MFFHFQEGLLSSVVSSITRRGPHSGSNAARSHCEEESEDDRNVVSPDRAFVWRKKTLSYSDKCVLTDHITNKKKIYINNLHKI